MTLPHINSKLRKLGDEIEHTIRSTSFQFSLFFTIAFSMCTMVSMVFIYNTAEHEISKQIDSRIAVESGRLRGFFMRRLSIGISSTALGMTERTPSDPGMSFCFIRKPTPQLVPQIDDKPFIMLNMAFQNLCNPSVASASNQKNGKMRVMISPLGNDHILIVGYDKSVEEQLLKAMSNVVFIVTLILLIVSFIGSYFLSRNIMHRISNISSTALHIINGDFSERIPSDNNADELSKLSDDLNQMLARIETLVASQRQVTNNIAHDLRSPLNRLRSRMEIALLDPATSCAELREVMEQSIHDAEDLLKTFNALLSIAQVESRARNDFELLDLSLICADMAELYEVITEDGDHTFRFKQEDNLWLKGNRQLIAQAITNLLDNAIKYTPNGGVIELSAYRQGHQVCVSVTDDGEGIPDDQYEEVIKRFVRLDAARSTPGNGLGLSLVSAIIDLHNGKFTLQNQHPGLMATLLFPAVAGKS